MSYELNLGPLSNEVLFLHNKHRALEVYKHSENFRSPINIMRSDRSFWKFVKQNPIGPRVEGYIRVAGFGGILDSGYRYIDHSLITLLVERWRPETHTFHLPLGETTVMLQQVNVLWDLPIKGLPVCGADNAITFSDAVVTCEEVMGLRPTENLVSGCTTFQDNSNNSINLHFLLYLHDLISCANINWGSAVLSCFWKGSLNHVDAPTHYLRSYRSQIQSVHERMFFWTLHDDVIGRLPGICTSGRDSWKSACPLISRRV
ncbi:serine/threonine-protein phosphatase 7 long form homolog [Helianthus annuus]|uniref:serine/threonine-protein phosphatase 7 long form homolog n=1 Tax=Helianthus annuus TaxID=4232 RepID=UPI000B8F4BDB|nr:serine/threonine-protein phosphatase 7 long form homolog [Helianthus annuus]